MDEYIRGWKKGFGFFFRLLKRVVKLVFHQNIISAYHHCATSSEISVKRKSKAIHKFKLKERKKRAQSETHFKNCGRNVVHPLLSCLSSKINSKVETVLGSVFVEAICLFCPRSSSNSMMILQPRMPHASFSLFLSISTETQCKSSHGKRTSVHGSKWVFFASRSIWVNLSEICWMASSLYDKSRKISSSSSWAGCSSFCFVLLGASVVDVQLEPVEEKNIENVGKNAKIQ